MRKETRVHTSMSSASGNCLMRNENEREEGNLSFVEKLQSVYMRDGG
jgi:hypothetical protein